MTFDIKGDLLTMYIDDSKGVIKPFSMKRVPEPTIKSDIVGTWQADIPLEKKTTNVKVISTYYGNGFYLSFLKTISTNKILGFELGKWVITSEGTLHTTGNGFEFYDEKEFKISDEQRKYHREGSASFKVEGDKLTLGNEDKTDTILLTRVKKEGNTPKEGKQEPKIV